MKLFALVLLSLISAIPCAHATFQVRETVLWNGREYAAEVPPAATGFFADRKFPEFYTESTANWGGYRAAWEIRNSRLYLTKFEGRLRVPGRDLKGDALEFGTGKERLTTLRHFNHGKPGPVFAAWQTGTVILANGDMIGLHKKLARYVYERELHVDVHAGVVIAVKVRRFLRWFTPV